MRFFPVSFKGERGVEGAMALWAGKTGGWIMGDQGGGTGENKHWPVGGPRVFAHPTRGDDSHGAGTLRREDVIRQLFAHQLRFGPIGNRLSGRVFIGGDRFRGPDGKKNDFPKWLGAGLYLQPNCSDIGQPGGATFGMGKKKGGAVVGGGLIFVFLWARTGKLRPRGPWDCTDVLGSRTGGEPGFRLIA